MKHNEVVCRRCSRCNSLPHGGQQGEAAQLESGWGMQQNTAASIHVWGRCCSHSLSGQQGEDVLISQSGGRVQGTASTIRIEIDINGGLLQQNLNNRVVPFFHRPYQCFFFTADIFAPCQGCFHLVRMVSWWQKCRYWSLIIVPHLRKLTLLGKLPKWWSHAWVDKVNWFATWEFFVRCSAMPPTVPAILSAYWNFTKVMLCSLLSRITFIYLYYLYLLAPHFMCTSVINITHI